MDGQVQVLADTQRSFLLITSTGLIHGQLRPVAKWFETTAVMKSVPLRLGPLPPLFEWSIPGRWDPVKQ
ncbi:hypothetical protein CHARACLAT_016865 [Characodon lateralis]|uniref:Uncharacterized protein n=1 Tax=Characodon lateralis TaxID=208331 RepID=A0ABU7D9F0_9TELE|nr:hypothetical protein [Characodon lateralis]